MTEKEFLEMIGDRGKQLRKKAKLTQGEVAEKANVYREDVSAFENGQGKTKSIDKIRRIIEATGHTMEDLFLDEDKKKLNLKLTSRASRSKPLPV